MSTAFQPNPVAGVRQPAYRNGPTIPPAIPAGTFAPGTKVQVGSHRVIIERYLSEGGFAHVYLVRLPKSIAGDDGAVLKRVAVPDKETLAGMRTEVETMQKLRGRRHIVTYIDSHASQIKTGGFEVFLLMEYCDGGGLIDFMNTRLQNRLTEPEVLKIFSDVALGVADMHYLKPPLLHRDLKVENVLITTSGSSKRYKLCDFGSTAPPRPAATNASDGRLIEEDVQKHTTLQYRSPEMVDVYRKQPIDEKSDIWALGVLLYKLCYYKTPFEDQGQMAILNASFKFPSYPSFSDSLKKLIAWTLQEQPYSRPNIYQVIREVSRLRGTDIPIKDIYAGRSQSEARRNQRLPAPPPDEISSLPAGAHKAPIEEKPLEVPDVIPMRRGRPTKAEGVQKPYRPSPSPAKVKDPFHALDSKQGPSIDDSSDDIASRFPPLDQFSLLHDSGSTFEFPAKASGVPVSADGLSQRVTNALADEAFGHTSDSRGKPNEILPRSSTEKDNIPKKASIRADREHSIEQAPPSRRKSPERPSMVSTGTMTSPRSPPSSSHAGRTSLTTHPVFKYSASEAEKAYGYNKTPADPELTESRSRLDANLPPRPGIMDHRSKSQILGLGIPKSPSSRPSLEIQRPTSLEVHESMQRSRSTNSKGRPVSESLSSKMGFLRSRKTSSERILSNDVASHLAKDLQSPRETDPMDTSNQSDLGRINSGVDFLRAMEEEDPARRKDKRLNGGSKHIKRSSMPSISLAGTKSLITGRFGEAFRKFESNPQDSAAILAPPSPSSDQAPHGLTPIAGSEVTDSRSDDGRVIDETEDVPPEMRRELERRRLSQEERRVAEAAAAYKQKVNQAPSSTIRGSENNHINDRATSIQTRVKSLLNESDRSSPTKSPALLPKPSQMSQSGAPAFAPDATPQLPSQSSQASRNAATTQRTDKAPAVGRKPLPTNNIPPALPTQASLPASFAPPELSTAPRQSAPPKPMSKPQLLRQAEARPPSPAKPSRLAGKTLPPVLPQTSRSPYSPSVATTISQPNRPSPSNQIVQHGVQPIDGTTDDDWESSFSKKYPDLSGLSMIETDIKKSKAPPSSDRDTRKIGEV